MNRRLIIAAAFLAAFAFGCPSDESSQIITDESGGQVVAGGGVPTATQPAAISGPRYSVSLLDPLYEATAGAKAVVIADIDGDGQRDGASISDESQPVQLHLRNTLLRQFETYVIAGGTPISKSVDIEAADLNSDGRLDLVVLVNDTGYAPPPNVKRLGCVVLLLQGADARNPYQWVRVVLTPYNEGSDAGLTDLVIGDFDGVNGPDLAVLSNEEVPGDNVADSFVLLYRNPGPAGAADPAQWARTRINEDIPDYSRAAAADVDQDGDLDVVCGVPQASSYNVRWLRNPLVELGPGAVTAGLWTERLIGQQEGGADFMAVGDIDLDGGIDVAASHKGQGLTQWFRNPGPAALASEAYPLPWEVYSIGQVTRSGDGISGLQLVDLDSNGRLNAFVTVGGEAWGFQRQTDVQNYWTPFMIFKTDPVAEIGRAGFDDFNGDGRLDFIVPLDRAGLTSDQFLIFTRQ